MQRIVIIGSSCSGKTTLARQLAQHIVGTHIELDALHWGPNWTPRPREDVCADLARAVARDRWVADGNYRSLREILWPRATTVIWLNYSFPVVFARALRRTTQRVFLRQELYNGNRETFRKAFLSRESILWWIIRSFSSRRAEYRAIAACNPYPHLQLIELRTPHQTAEFLRGFTALQPQM